MDTGIVQNDMPSLAVRARFRHLLRGIKIRARRAEIFLEGKWGRLSEGIELNDLWTQFKAEAEVSSRPYKQDMDRQSVTEKSWKKPFKILGALFSSVLKKLSPPRRIFLLITIALACAAVAGLEFLFITKEVEFILAFGGLLALLALVVGDHVSMKRDVEIARE